MPKEFLALLDAFWTFMVQQGETIAHNHEKTKLMGQITEGLGAINGVPSGGFAKVTIKARLLDSFARKETKTKRVWLWLQQIETYMEMQSLKIDKEQIHFVHTLLKEHAWEWWMF